MPNDLPFRVTWSLQVRQTLKRLAGQADETTRSALVQIVRSLDDRLRRNPLAVGEIYRSRGGILEHLAVSDFLAIEFAVDQGRKFVLVRGCQALSGHGLE
jgi:hypothetical protein